MKTIFKLTLLGVLVLAISCSQESVADPVQENLTSIDLKGGKAVPRPISIVLEGSDNEDGPGGIFTGRMTHLGKIDGTVAPSTLTPIDLAENIFSIETNDGEFDVINAANGDQLFSRGSLIFDFNEEFTAATYTGTIFFTSGNGRFNNVVDPCSDDNPFPCVPEFNFMIIENGVYDLTSGPPGIFSHTAAGTITY